MCTESALICLACIARSEASGVQGVAQPVHAAARSSRVRGVLLPVWQLATTYALGCSCKGCNSLPECMLAGLASPGLAGGGRMRTAQQVVAPASSAQATTGSWHSPQWPTREQQRTCTAVANA